MSDSIYLEIGGKRIEHFLSYTVEADLYVADHAFSLEVANPEAPIFTGQQLRLYVNDRLELTGIIDRRLRRCDKSGRKLVVEGRDLMGVLVDAYCEEFVDVQGKKLSELAAMLIGPNTKTGRPALPFISRKNIVYQQDLTGKLKSKRQRGTADLMAMFNEDPQRLSRIAPGMTVFQALQMYALSRGQMFFSLPDGTFVFGRPKVGGASDYVLNLNQDGIGVNVISAEVDENISKRYSKVTVVGQQQVNPDDAFDAAVRSPIVKSVTDPDFPFYKAFVQCSNNDSQSPALHARLLMERMRHEGFRLTYEVPRHSVDGENYTINTLAQVNDDIHDVHGQYLVSGRSFKLDRQNGPTTTLRLSKPGLVEDMPLKRGHR